MAWIDMQAHVMGCNDAYRAAPWIDALYAADGHWWDLHIDRVRKSSIDTLYSGDRKSCEKYGLWHTPVDLSTPYENLLGLSLDARNLHHGGHSGFQLLNIAVHLGAKRILLLGYDCGFTHPHQSHWFGQHPGRMEMKTPYPLFMRFYEQAATQLTKLEVECINCSSNSALEAFPKRGIASCF